MHRIKMIPPAMILTVHPPKNPQKTVFLTLSMKKRGWTGRPLLAYDDGDGWYRALTGSHRIHVAVKVGLAEVPAYVMSRRFMLHLADTNELGIQELGDEIENCPCDSIRLEKLRAYGFRHAASILKLEMDINNAESADNGTNWV
jgi:hypothetical protein